MQQATGVMTGSVYKVRIQQYKTRTDSVQKVCGGVWKGFDHLTNLESSKVEVVLQWGLRSSSTL